ncbi:hypothetical protein GQ600_21911 [Phytophthora cactorum]|nr:hypothetical protein GQ600_21911 [Phytophthora cactorum]
MGAIPVQIFPAKIRLLHDRPDTITQFWGSFNWSNNMWVRNKDEKQLSKRKFDRIKPCTRAELEIQRTGPAEFLMTIPSETSTMGIDYYTISTPYSHWEGLTCNPPLKYTWRLTDEGAIEGKVQTAAAGENGQVRLDQADDGIHWFFRGEPPTLLTDTEQEAAKWKQNMQANGLVFKAHPCLHRFPWKVPNTVSNKHILKA